MARRRLVAAIAGHAIDGRGELSGSWARIEARVQPAAPSESALDEVRDATGLPVGAVGSRGCGRVISSKMQPADRLLKGRNGSRALRRENREAVLPRLQVRAEHPP